jgi:hypothetical protein
MRKLLLSAALISLALPAFAQSGQGLFPGLPAIGSYTGNERIPADTEYPNGANPQTGYLTPFQLGFGALQQSTPVTAFTITAVNPTSVIEITPAGTLATGTIVFPANPVDRQELAIYSTQTQTALTLTPSAGTTINAAVTALVANVGVAYKYNAATLVWYRIR